MNRRVVIIIVAAISIIIIGAIILLKLNNNNNNIEPEIEIEVGEEETNIDAPEFDDLFDNSMHYQEYTINADILTESTKDLVYTIYESREKSDGKYDINVKLPYINMENPKINQMNKDIIVTYGTKVQSILSAENEINTIYTAEYTGYLNGNILSLVIKSTLKEGNNAQRTIITTYNYDISTKTIVPLKKMLEMKNIEIESVEKDIKDTVQSGIDQTKALKELGYNLFERDITSEIYKIENTDNYIIGPNGVIYIIYAYGNTNFTSEKDVVIVK